MNVEVALCMWLRLVVGWACTLGRSLHVSLSPGILVHATNFCTHVLKREEGMFIESDEVAKVKITMTLTHYMQHELLERKYLSGSLM